MSSVCISDLQLPGPNTLVSVGLVEMVDSFCREQLARPTLVPASHPRTDLCVFLIACSGAIHASGRAPAAAGKQSPLATDHITFHNMSTNKMTNTSDGMAVVTRRSADYPGGEPRGTRRAVPHLQWWGELSRGLSCSEGALHRLRRQRGPATGRRALASAQRSAKCAETRPGGACRGRAGKHSQASCFRARLERGALAASTQEVPTRFSCNSLSRFSGDLKFSSSL